MLLSVSEEKSAGSNLWGPGEQEPCRMHLSTPTAHREWALLILLKYCHSPQTFHHKPNRSIAIKQRQLPRRDGGAVGPCCCSRCPHLALRVLGKLCFWKHHDTMSQCAATLTGQADPSFGQHLPRAPTGTAQCQMPGPPPGRRWQKTLDLPSFTWRLHAVQTADGWAGPWSLMWQCVQVSWTLWKVSSVSPRLLLERQGGLWVKMGNWWGGPAFLTASPSSWVRSHQQGSTWTCQLQTGSSEGAGTQAWHRQWHTARRAVPSAQEGPHGKQEAEHQVTGLGQIRHCRLLAVTMGRWISLHLCFFLFAKIRTPTSHRCNY